VPLFTLALHACSSQTIFCHIGSIIFGAAVVAVCRLITLVLVSAAA